MCVVFPVLLDFLLKYLNIYPESHEWINIEIGNTSQLSLDIFRHTCESYKVYYFSWCSWIVLNLSRFYLYWTISKYTKFITVRLFIYWVYITNKKHHHKQHTYPLSFLFLPIDIISMMKCLLSYIPTPYAWAIVMYSWNNHTSTRVKPSTKMIQPSEYQS